jgi:RNA polymerase sigma factor (sigma-70 family)
MGDMGHTMAVTDAELLEASRRGEHAAFGTIVERYQDVVCAVSYSRTRDQALSEDVAQETFLAAWRQLDQLREPNRLRSWLCGIAKNLARKAKKRSARETLVDEPQLTAHDNPFDAVSDAQAERVVGDALERVPETYRDVLVLYYREQKSIRDVARALEISESAALQRLARGRQYLADGVNALVEKSLRALPRKSLVVGVLAALPMIVPSRVDASTHGGNMLTKIAIAATALAAAGTTAYVARNHSSDTPASTAKVVTAAAPTPATPAPRVAQVPTATPRLHQPIDEHGNPIPPHLLAPPPDTEPTLTRDQIAKLHLEEGPSQGAANAPVVITAFTDLKCKYCAAAVASLDQLVEEYPNKLRIVVKQMPVHESAKLAAEAALAADAQGKFWDMHDLMMANMDSDLSRDQLLALAQQAGLNVATFRGALDAHTYASAVAADIKTGQDLEFKGVPAFVINGRKITGAVPVPAFRAAIDSALADAQ